MSFTPPSMRISTPGEAVSVVPYLLGFHPQDSIVVIAIRQQRVHTVARFDLPANPADLRAYRPAAHELAQRLLRYDIDTTVVIGYGPAEPVVPATAETTAALLDVQIVVHDALRVTDARWWSLTCANPQCCPPEGTAFDVGSSVAAATAVAAGIVALPDRDAVAATLAPVQGAARQAASAATATAIDRLLALAGVPARQRRRATTRGAVPPPIPMTMGVFAEGLTTLAALKRTYQSRESADDGTAATGTVLLSLQPLRDLAIRQAEGIEWHIAMWSDLVRRAEPRLVPGPAVLLAVTAILAGNSVLAEAAVHRALDVDTDQELAHLLLQLVRSGIDPDSMAAAIAVLDTPPSDEG